MSSNLKFPSTVEIKRVIAATARAGIEIGSIDIYPRKITIHPREKNAPPLGDYDIWKVSDRQNTQHVRHADEESDALPKKPRR